MEIAHQLGDIQTERILHRPASFAFSDAWQSYAANLLEKCCHTTLITEGCDQCRMTAFWCIGASDSTCIACGCSACFGSNEAVAAFCTAATHLCIPYTPSSTMSRLPASSCCKRARIKRDSTLRGARTCDSHCVVVETIVEQQGLLPIIAVLSVHILPLGLNIVGSDLTRKKPVGERRWVSNYRVVRTSIQLSSELSA